MTTRALRDMECALELVYGGTQQIEAGCVLDHLSDMGWVLSPAPQVRVEQDPLPLEASTRNLKKRRSA